MSNGLFSPKLRTYVYVIVIVVSLTITHQTRRYHVIVMVVVMIVGVEVCGEDDCRSGGDNGDGDGKYKLRN